MENPLSPTALIEKTGPVAHRDLESSVLDNMDLERSGHYDQAPDDPSDLSRSGWQGSISLISSIRRDMWILLTRFPEVGAAKRCAHRRRYAGVEAQTLANVYLALMKISKSFRSSIRSTCRAPARMTREDGGRRSHRYRCGRRPLISAKEGINIEAVLEDIVKMYRLREGQQRTAEGSHL